MKVTKTNVYRLEVERDCGCKGTREYDDPRYQKALTEGTTTLCEKHTAKSDDAQEILREMIIDALGMQAEQAGKQYAPLRQVAEGDSAGVTAIGDNVQALGVTNLPKGPRRDPLGVTHMQVYRPAPRTRGATPTSSLNVAPVENAQDGIEISPEIGEEAPEDPRLSAYLEDALGGLGVLDQDDAKSQGVPQKFLQDSAE